MWQVQYRIGDQKFPDLASLLAFYKCHYLDTTPLVRPAPKRIEKVTAKYDFEGRVSGGDSGTAQADGRRGQGLM